ncbi:Pre-mRNA-splicing factor prp46 [Verticillium dahliae VDG1]|nr:Pre-mRNA-splicing factor prp46 [Verticillium dahliae VDG1]
MEGSYKQTTTVLQLAEHQGRESRVLKTLTFLALIYVPASSLPKSLKSMAVISSPWYPLLTQDVNLGQDVLLMDYIETRTEDGGLRLRASTGLALFAALALPLVSVTMGIHWYAEHVVSKAANLQRRSNPNLTFPGHPSDQGYELVYVDPKTHSLVQKKVDGVSKHSKYEDPVISIIRKNKPEKFCRSYCPSQCASSKPQVKTSKSTTTVCPYGCKTTVLSTATAPRPVATVTRALTTVLTRLLNVKAPTSTILTTVTDTSTVTEVTTTTTTSVISIYFKSDTSVPGGLDEREPGFPPISGAQTVKKVVTATICERQQPVIGISITPPGRFVELGHFETAPGAAPPASGAKAARAGPSSRPVMPMGEAASSW